MINFENITTQVKSLLSNVDVAHDFAHIQRVLNNAELIAKDMQFDRDLLRLVCLLHDADDRKLFDGTKNAEKIMLQCGVDKELCALVLSEIDAISFSKGGTPSTLEGRVAQDADRLDAIGAIGIARAFAYGGSRGEALYGTEHSTVQHFYDKLLKLKDLMNLDVSRQLAQQRTDFMLDFLARLNSETV